MNPPLLPADVLVAAVIALLQPVAALIQMRGEILPGGEVSGTATVPLERAAGGDTPVLTFRSAAGEVRLLLDTGASSSMIRPEVARRLSLPLQQVSAADVSLVGGGEGCGGLRPLRTRLPTLTLSAPAGSTPAGSGRQERPLRIEAMEALVLPVPALPEAVDGVLGVPTLRLLPFLIDPRRDQIRLGRSALLSDDSRPGPPRQTLPLRWHLGVPLMRLTTISGPAEALLDTGAEGIFLSSPLAARLLPLGPAQPLRMVGICGEETVQRRRFAGIALPGQSLLDPQTRQGIEAILTTNPVFSALGIELIVGQPMLRHRAQRWRLDRTPPLLELW